VINSEAAWFARSNADPGTLAGPSELAFHDADLQVRAENLSVDEIRSGGALSNVFSGAKIDVIEAPMVFVLWPGYGPRSTGFHFANGEEGLTSAVHTHPASDECVVLWDGTAKAWAQGAWHDMEQFDVVFAPCGVEHGISMVLGEALWGGFADRDYASTPVRFPPEWPPACGCGSSASLMLSSGRIFHRFGRCPMRRSTTGSRK
jgi:gentisate 1,2-dioxygenase